MKKVVIDNYLPLWNEHALNKNKQTNKYYEKFYLLWLMDFGLVYWHPTNVHSQY